MRTSDRPASPEENSLIQEKTRMFDLRKVVGLSALFFACAGGVGVTGMTVAVAATGSESLKPGDVFSDCADVCPQMVVIPAGRITRQAPKGDKKPAAIEVEIKSVAVGRFEITFREYDACVAARACTRISDLGWGRDRRPVINISWNDAQTYVRWLSGRTGHTYRLLSDAEWEYAARAGQPVSAKPAKDLDVTQAVFAPREKTEPVGTRPANGFGLYDMFGNALEWVEDCWSAADTVARKEGTSPRPEDCRQRVLRGGSWVYGAAFLRPNARFKDRPSAINLDQGIRIARELSRNGHTN